MSQYMVFQIGNEYYGMEILKVKEIVDLVPLTFVPKAPQWVSGVLNHHGRVVTVINLSSFFNLPSSDILQRIAVVEEGGIDVGFVLSGPIEVISDWEDLEAQDQVNHAAGGYIGKTVLSGGRMVNFIDIERLISGLEGFFE